MGEWSNLTQREKSNIIRFAIKNGVSDINQIRDTFNVYISGNGRENEYKEGGSIHIKHPGRLTALKEKTGKTEAELWATGNAHTRKMITFARNARKWHKGADGLNLDTGTSREFLPNENIQNKEVWLNYGTRFQKQRPGTVNIQNIQNALDSFGSDIQYVWDSPEHKTYSAYRINPNYRPPLIPAERIETPLTGIATSSLALPKITVSIPRPKYLPKKVNVPTGTYIPLFGENNGAQGYVVSYLERSPDNKDYYQIEYQSAPGSLNNGEGSVIQTDSVAAGLPIEDINTRIFDYKTKAGGHFAKTELSTGGPLYPFSFQKNPYWKTPVVRYDNGGGIRNWDNALTGKLINYVENSDSIGWNPVDRTWEHPTLSGYDKNQIGMGVDRNKTPGYWDSIQNRPKTNIPFLTELDERLIRHNAVEAANKSANERYKFAQGAVNRPKGTISPVKDAAVVSAIYNLGAGYVANGLFEDKDFMLKLFDGTDKEVVDRINQEYKKKGRNERIAKTNLFLFQK